MSEHLPEELLALIAQAVDAHTDMQSQAIAAEQAVRKADGFNQWRNDLILIGIRELVHRQRAADNVALKRGLRDEAPQGGGKAKVAPGSSYRSSERRLWARLNVLGRSLGEMTGTELLDAAAVYAQRAEGNNQMAEFCRLVGGKAKDCAVSQALTDKQLDNLAVKAGFESHYRKPHRPIVRRSSLERHCLCDAAPFRWEIDDHHQHGIGAIH